MAKEADKRPLSEEEISFSEIIGDLIEQWGFNRHLGRIWSILFLRPSPLSATEIQECLGLSAGTVSAGLTELQTWGVVKRSRLAGDRNSYFEAETQIWKSVSNVLRARELRILDEAQNGMEALGEILQKSAKGDRALFQVKRVKHIRDAIDTAKSLFGNLTGPQAPSVVKLNSLFNKLKSL